jgi:hypothetical protein
MPVVAAVLLGIAALGGLLLARLRMKGGNPPLLFAFVHGSIAAVGVVTLGIAAFTLTVHAGPLKIAFGILLLAALLGANLVRHHLAGRLIPLGALMLHALVAVTGYCFLLAYFFSSSTQPPSAA